VILACLASIVSFAEKVSAENENVHVTVLRWEDIPGIKGYIIQIAEDETFKKIIVNERVHRNYYRWTTLPQKEYYWRVKSIDIDGRHGKFSPAQLFKPLVRPPDLIFPDAEIHIGYGSQAPVIEFRWERLDLLKGYIIEIESADEMKHFEVNNATSFNFSPWKTGTFRWNVTGIDLNGQPTRPSEPRNFTVYPKAPKLVQPHHKKNIFFKESLNVALSWNLRPVSHYQIELAVDPDFRQVVSDLTVDRTSTTLRLDTTGIYYWRVRGLSPQSGWSKIRVFRVIPAIPSPLLPSHEEVISWDAGAENIFLSWSSVPKAVKYQVDIAFMDGDNPEWLTPMVVEGTSTELPSNVKGTYLWQVRAIDHGGNESMKSEPRKFVLAPPEPLLQAEPKIAEKVEQSYGPLAYLYKHLFVGPRVGFIYNMGEVSAFRCGMELGRKFNAWDRSLSMILSIDYYRSTAAVSENGVNFSAESTLHAIPIEIVALTPFSIKLFDLYAGGGLHLDILRSSLSVPNLPKISRTDIEFGFVVIAGVERKLGPGNIIAEGGYAFTSETESFIDVNPGGFTISAGYRIKAW